MSNLTKRRMPSRHRPFRLTNLQIQSWFSAFTEALGQSRPFSPGSTDISPELHTCPDKFARDYLLSEILSKLDDGLPSPTKAKTTWDRFFEAEELCRQTNEALRKPSFGPDVFNVRSPYSVIMTAQRYMGRLLGRLDWNEVAVGFGWGPGASTRLSRARAHTPNKFDGRPESTIGNAALASAAIAAVPRWKAGLTFEEGSGYCKIVPGNRIVTVPKSYKTDRTIAIEPDMNMYVQKGLGAVIRRRLRRVGIDLDDQSKNRRLALLGSFTGTLATIDLSMASDTVSYELVRLLLPPDWFDALEQCRSYEGVLPSDVAAERGIPERLRYQKFSSMGNGYTFELETAIFCCLAWATAELYDEEDHRISVYGDDIICPTRIAGPLMEVLRVAGFKPNAQKTFSTGQFRESCGIHALNGYDVTPFYIRRTPATIDDLFLLHNQLYRWCMRVKHVLDVSAFWPLIQWLRGLAPPRWRKPRLPDGFGDGAFIGTFDEATPRRARHYIEGYFVEHRVAVADPLPNQPDHMGRLLASLYNLELGDGKLLREGTILDRPRTVVVRSLVPQFALEDPFSSFA